MIWLRKTAWRLGVPTGLKSLFSRCMWPILDRKRETLYQSTMHEVFGRLRECRYKGDPLGGAFDRARHPEALEWLYASSPKPVVLGDCDDFAIWAAAQFSDELEAKILSVAWVTTEPRTGKSQFRGHAVCVFSANAHIYHIGNYAEGRPFGPYESVGELIERMMEWRDPGNRYDLVGWALISKDLKRVLRRRT